MTFPLPGVDESIRALKRIGYVVLIVAAGLLAFGTLRGCSESRRADTYRARYEKKIGDARSNAAKASEQRAWGAAGWRTAERVALSAQQDANAADEHRQTITAEERASLPVSVAEQLRLDSLAIASARLIAPAYHESVTHYAAAADLGLLAAYDCQEAIGALDEAHAIEVKQAHRQGFKAGALTLAGVVVVVKGAATLLQLLK